MTKILMYILCNTHYVADTIPSALYIINSFNLILKITIRYLSFIISFSQNRKLKHKKVE